MDKVAVLEQLEPLRKSDLRKVNHRAGARVMLADDLASIRTGKGARALTFADEGLDSLFRFVNLPVAMSKNLSPDTRGRVINELLERKDQYGVVVRDNEVVGIAGANQIHSAINTDKLLKLLDKSVSGVNYQRVIVDGPKARIELASDRQEIIAKGDVIQAGAVVQFSPLGIAYPRVEPYTVRVLCTNGMTTNDNHHEFSNGGGGDDVWKWFRDKVRGTLKAVSGIAARYRKMVEDNIPPAERAAVIEAMIRRAGLPPSVADAVRAAAIERPPENAWDAMNLITYASTHQLDEPRRIYRAQKAAADFADEATHARICPACHKSQ